MAAKDEDIKIVKNNGKMPAEEKVVSVMSKVAKRAKKSGAVEEKQNKLKVKGNNNHDDSIFDSRVCDSFKKKNIHIYAFYFFQRLKALQICHR